MEEQEILEIYLKEGKAWKPFDLSLLDQSEIDSINSLLSEEYWKDRDQEEEDLDFFENEEIDLDDSF